MTSKLQKFLRFSKGEREASDPYMQFDEALAELVIAGVESGLSGPKLLQVASFNLTEFACEIFEENMPLILWMIFRSTNLRLQSRIPDKLLDGIEEIPFPPEIEITWTSESGREEAFFASNALREELEKFLDMKLKSEDCSVSSPTSH